MGHLRRVAPRRAPHGIRGRRCHRRGRHDGCGGGVERRGQPGGRRAQSAAAAKQAEAAAAQAKASQTKTPQQKLAELQSLYDQKLISASDYEAAKTKILNQMTQ